ncbi:hypothetical protein CCL17_26580 [Pseudomonas congelans]|nr:hypothetical protein CCL17_26580 [Pseudomonas congelans]PBQ16179.1 hypothetical protein CCL08_16660 [Pseudomonas congelans]
MPEPLPRDAAFKKMINVTGHGTVFRGATTHHCHPFSRERAMTTNALERRLDNNYERANRSYESVTKAAADDPSVENMQAIFEETMKTSSANFAMNQAFKVKHSLTKTVLDGFQ